MSEDRGVPDGQGASGPEEARQRSSKVVAQHKMRQPSKGQTVWNRLAKEREQKSSVLGRPHADHPVGKQPRKPSPPRLGTGKEKSYVEHRPLRKGWEDPRHNWHRGHGARGWASRPNVGRPQVPSGRSRASPGLRVPRSRSSGRRRKEARPEANSGHYQGFPSRGGRGSPTWQCPGSATAVPGSEHPQRRAGRARLVAAAYRRDSRRRRPREGTPKRLEIAYHWPQPVGSRVTAPRGYFRISNRLWTYFEELQSHKHRSTSM